MRNKPNCQNFTWKNIQTTGEENSVIPHFPLNKTKVSKCAILTAHIIQISAPAQEDLHRGRQEAAGVRVQGADEEQAGGDEAAVVPRRGPGP